MPGGEGGATAESNLQPSDDLLRTALVQGVRRCGRFRNLVEGHLVHEAMTVRSEHEDCQFKDQ